MNPQRVSVKFFAKDPAERVELDPFIGMFHRFIQEATLDGLLLDVADYIHVPQGPGVILIGHDVDYGIDQAEGRVGLLTTRKRYGGKSAADALRATLASALRAVEAIEAAGDLRFATGSLQIQLLDRLAAPNDDATYEAALAQVTPVLQELFGEKHDVTRAHAGDPRKPLGFDVSAPEAGAAIDLAKKLGSESATAQAASAAAGPAQSPWDISVEELKRLRDEGADFVLVDVREAHEFEICDLGGELIPLGAFGERYAELDAKAHVVVHCRSGVRSAKAVELLRGAGFTNAWNVQGGILAWIDRIDPSLTKY